MLRQDGTLSSQDDLDLLTVTGEKQMFACWTNAVS